MSVPRRYDIQFKPSAANTLRKLPKGVQRRIAARVAALAENPRPRGVEKLAGLDATYRVRVGDYRIIYATRDDVLLVLVLKIGHRREVYR